MIDNSNSKEQNDDEDLFFAEDSDISDEAPNWEILVVDDEKDVHNVTNLVLKSFNFQKKKLSLLHAYSGEEAKRILTERPDIALVLLDVVMENDHAGLDVVTYVRDVLQNKKVRIVLRTGQPGASNEKEIIRNLEINDYRNKTEFSSKKLSTSIINMLRAYLDVIHSHETIIANSMIFSASNTDKWKIMVVDDGKSGPNTIPLVLSSFDFGGKGVQLITARSIEEARQLLRENYDIALILLDLNTGDNTDILNIVQYIRNELKYQHTRILVRAGDAGTVTENEIVELYEINDYREKSELTPQKLDTTICALLRAYRDVTHPGSEIC